MSTFSQTQPDLSGGIGWEENSVDCRAVFRSEIAPIVLAELAVRPLQPDEQTRAAELLAQEQYLGADKSESAGAIQD